MNETPNRRLMLLGLGIFLIIILGIGIWLHSAANKKAPFYTKTVVDNCSGKAYTTTPNQGVETFQSSDPNVLIGGSAILDAGATQAQYLKIQQALAQYLNSNLKNTYRSLTIAPNTLKAIPGSAEITAKLCLGLSGNKVNLAIKLTQLTYVQVKITDPTGRNGGDYNSGLLNAVPPSDHGL